MALEPTRSVPLLRYDPLDLISNLAEEARYYRIKGQPEQMLAVVKEMFEVWPDKSRALMEVAGPTDSFRPVDLQFADERRLWGYHADMQGDLIVSLAWEKLASRGATVFPAVQALTPSRDVVGCGGACRPVSLYPMGYVPLPDAFLPAGVQYIDVYHLPLDSLPSGPTVRLRALLSDMQGNSQPSLKLDGSPGDGFVGFAKVQAPKPFHLSQIPVSAEVTFGDGIALRGYSLGLAEGGREAVLDLYWQSLATPQADYTIFVHLVDLSSNSIIAQQDNPPLQGTFPTGLWQAGDSLVDTYRLRLPEIVKPGTYQLRVGLYQPETGQRLTVIDSNRPVQDGAVLIAEVEY